MPKAHQETHSKVGGESALHTGSWGSTFIGIGDGSLGFKDSLFIGEFET